MTFTIDNVVPWGRSLNEYGLMFALSESDRNAAILGCGDGPASFNAEMYQEGKHVVSVDPLYRFSARRIKARIEAAYPLIMEQVYVNLEKYIWKAFESPEHLGRVRMAAMEQFLADFELGKKQGRYLPYELPQLPFKNRHFDLAVTSHLLFLYADHLSLEFHLDAIKEMLRVATEVRIFPLLTLDGAPYPQHQSIYAWIARNSYHFELETVDYEFQRGGNQFIRIW